jgi:hypothetical protein
MSERSAIEAGRVGNPRSGAHFQAMPERIDLLDTGDSKGWVAPRSAFAAREER